MASKIKGTSPGQFRATRPKGGDNLLSLVDAPERSPVATRKAAVFLDRDGVVIEEVDYLSRPEQLKLIPGAARAIARLRKAGLKVVVITNQSGVARGYLTLKTLREVHALLRRRLAAQGAALDGLYFCPHLPARAGGKGCDCRKPGLSLLKRAQARFHLDFSRSYFVGDSTTDVLTAKRAGCTAVLVRTGKAGRDGVYRVQPHRVCRNLPAAADWIIGAGSRTPALRRQADGRRRHVQGLPGP